MNAARPVPIEHTSQSAPRRSAGAANLKAANVGSANVWRLFPVRYLAAGVVVALVGVLTAPSLLAQDDDDDERRGGRRDWDAAAYIKRLDRDGDGRLSPEEMGGRNSRFIEGMGFDPSRALSVDSVLRGIEKRREAEETKERREEIDANRKLPKFGEDIDYPKVPRFGVDLEGGNEGISAVEEDFDERTFESIKAIMERYDENKDGFLAGEETRRIGRWIGGVDEADADEDGKLSPVEIAEGIKAQRQRRERGDRGDRGEDRGRRGRGGDDDNEGDRGERRSRDRSNNGSSSNASSESSSGPSMDARMISYVDGIYRKYDRNQDNQLDKEEMETVKVKFKDTDGDGLISRDEAMAFVSGARRSGGSVSPASRGGASRSGESENDSVRRDVVPAGQSAPIVFPGRRNDDDDEANGSREFRELDKNGDGQLQMIEFAAGERWSDKLYEQFLAADRNDDGVITADEYDD